MEAMLYKGRFVNPALSEFVLRYEVVRFVFGKDVLPPVKYFVPRPEQSITFYARQAQRVRYADSSEIIVYPRVVINGMHNVPIYRYGGHDFLAIKVVLQPGTLYRLTGIPSHQLTNTFVDAEAIWPTIRAVSERLASTDDLPEMLTIIELFFVNLIRNFRKSFHAVDQTSQLILRQQSRLSLDQLADQSCLSVRQLIRKFDERIGVSPKMFDRIARFDNAFRMRNKYPSLDWLSVALACGYYDHQHFAKDCKELTHLTPTSYFEQESKSPERLFGLHED